jgi:hypothetical protein
VITVPPETTNGNPPNKQAQPMLTANAGHRPTGAHSERRSTVLGLPEDVLVSSYVVPAFDA